MAVREGATTVGEITSGCLSPTLGRPIAMAYVRADLAHAGQRLSIETGRGESLEARVAPLPFYKAPKG